MSPVASLAKRRQVLRECVAKAVVRLARRGEPVASLAKRLKVTEGTVRNWLGGKGYPNYTTADRIAPLVGVAT